MDNSEIIKAEKFWNWINDYLTKNGPINSTFFKEIDEQISKIGKIDWEIGSWGNDGEYLAISPNLNLNLHEFTKEFIKYAPVIPNWSFLDCKPAKENYQELKYSDFNQNIVTLNLKSWNFLLFEDNDKFYLEVFFDDEIHKNDICNVIEIAITNLIGEYSFMHKVSEFSYFKRKELPQDYENKIMNIDQLKQFFVNLRF